ncbi:hypothetical protein HY086_04060 [Candidatus Gottesmanbacteria bacterium]|nr:hypothetical protein [Candidatus Gottesmanbacteria bacterium]
MPRFGQRSIVAIVVVFALVAGMFFPFAQVKAGTFTSAKVTISDSRAGQTSVTDDFAFTTTLTTSIKQVDIQMCTTASGTCTAPTGFSSGTPTLASDNLAGTDRTTTAPTANAFRVVVTTPATQSTQAVTMSFTGTTNPTTTNTTYYARITTYSDTGTTQIDTATIAFAILTSTSIAVTASVDPTLTFTVSAVTSGGTVNGATTNVTDTATTIPFGTLSSGSTKIAAHDLAVTTNALLGYTVTVKALADPPLVDGGNNIDIFTGTNAAPTVWSSPAGTTANVNTGFFGYTTNDATLGTGTADRFTSAGGNKWSGTSTSPLELAYSSVGIGPSAETTRVGWQSEVNTLQPPGSYSGTVVLVATPTY